MTFSEIRKKEGRISGLVALERALPYGLRSKSKKFLILPAPFIMVFLLSFKDQLFLPANVLYGIMFFIPAIWLIIFMLDAFYDSHYFEGAHFAIHEWGVVSHKQCIPFEVLEIVSHTHSGDLTGGFLDSRAGKDIMFRLDVMPEKVREFVTGNRPRIYADLVNFDSEVNLASYAATIFSVDKYFASFLAEQGVVQADYVATAAWVAAIYEKKKEAFRWWGRDSLGRIKSLGKDWAHGETGILDRYSSVVTPEDNETLFKKEIDEVEKELSRESNTDIFLVANEYRKLLAVTSGLSMRIRNGSVLPPIEHKKILLLDTQLVEQASVVEGQFESLMIQLLNQVVSSEHLILVIKDFPGFVRDALAHHFKAADLLRPYLLSPYMQIIGFVEESHYGKNLGSEEELVGRFKIISIEDDNINIIIRALEEKTFDFERIYKIHFSYQALVAIAETARLKFPNADSEVKAFEIFENLGLRLIKKDVKKVTVKDVKELS